MDTQPLENLGFTRNEAKTYIALCKAGVIGAGDLCKKIDNIHRSRVYDALDRLCSKGVVSYTVLNGVKQYKAKPPVELTNILQMYQNQLTTYIPKLERLQEFEKRKQRVDVFTGIGGIKSLFKRGLQSSKQLVLGAPKQSVDLMGESYWQNYGRKMHANNVRAKMIFNEDLRKFVSDILPENPNSEIRFLPKYFESLTETVILDDAVMLIIFSMPPIGILIEDALVASSYAQFFALLWPQATR